MKKKKKNDFKQMIQLNLIELSKTKSKKKKDHIFLVFRPIKNPCSLSPPSHPFNAVYECAVIVSFPPIK